MEISLAVALCLILASILSYELKVSSAVLEVVAGMTLGIFIVDLNAVDWLHYLSGIGVLALMFVAGFEIRISALKKTWAPSLAIGLFSFLFPFSGVFLATYLWLGMDWMACTLISVGLSTTSLALVYHLMKEHCLLSTEEGQILFGAASIVDIISMVLLAVVLGEIGFGTFIFACIFAVCLFIIPRSARWLFKRYSNVMSEPELRFLMVIIVGMSFMAEEIGSLHPALIAFTIGVFMSRFIERNQVVKHKLMALVFSFFAPIFFFQSGAKIDLGDLNTNYLLIFAVLFVLATSLKFIGTYLPARKFAKPLAAYSGKIFNFRLSFGIISATVGLEKGLIDEGMFAVIMLVVISSAAIPSIFLRNHGCDTQGLKYMKLDASPEDAEQETA